ncbi:hypothetical protein CBR65_07065 [Cellvibrio sp. PSBB006]|nr:hypothetical protein CBR65_07065 [Cellvibrio sp. PSBB006]
MRMIQRFRRLSWQRIFGGRMLTLPHCHLQWMLGIIKEEFSWPFILNIIPLRIALRIISKTTGISGCLFHGFWFLFINTCYSDQRHTRKFFTPSACIFMSTST